MPTLANVKVDGEKLREAIFERNLDFKDVHEKLGVAPGYIQRVIRRNTISAKKMVQLEKIVGIKREEYVLEDQNLNMPQINQDTKKELYDLIYHAVYKAVKTAWQDD